MATAAIDRTALADLEARFFGMLVGRDHPAYDEHRAIWNGSIDRRPALIARCAGEDDVAASVAFGRRTGLPVAVRSGGHSFPGLCTCDDGLVIDTSLMKAIEVDPDTATVRAQAGVLLGELDQATQSLGMAVPAGIVTHTGLAGLTLGGGIGWLQRKYGLTVDQLLSVRVVTADGRHVTASPDENADLFWGIRGAGTNFGVVTEFEFRLNPLGPEVLAGAVVWRTQDSPEVMRFYRDWIEDVPDELTTIVMHRRAPALPALPPDLHGEPVVMVGCCFAGPVEEGERVLEPLRRFGRPAADLCRPKPFVEHQAMFDATFPHGRWYYFQSRDVQRLSDELIDVTAEHMLRIESPHSGSPIFHLGGAVALADTGETAFSGRSAGHTINVNGVSETAEGFDAEREWVRSYWQALEPYGVGVYVNFLMDEGEARVRAAYGKDKYDRLRALKREWDPDNLFHLNQNIPPTA
ncbi:MAG TPA: FAD-binding oxidoreductase [Thermoleophilaceae bacterium]|nr:FAD-binding oxidoreductase [Thermoleophilaceae bacterium]